MINSHSFFHWIEWRIAPSVWIFKKFVSVKSVWDEQSLSGYYISWLEDATIVSFAQKSYLDDSLGRRGAHGIPPRVGRTALESEHCVEQRRSNRWVEHTRSWWRTRRTYKPSTPRSGAWEPDSVFASNACKKKVNVTMHINRVWHGLRRATAQIKFEIIYC